MKVHKVISLDLEVVQRLKEEDNASGLINSLLIKNYKDLRGEEEIIEDVKKKIKENKKKEKEHSKYINKEYITKRLKEMKKTKDKRSKKGK